MVDFHESGFVSQLNGHHAFTQANGFWFQLSGGAREDAEKPDGPVNPQALNRFAYTLNNPVKYTDPSGHFGVDPSDPMRGGGGPGGGLCIRCFLRAGGQIVGLTAAAARSAFDGMRGGGGHAIRHLIEAGIILNRGSLAAKLEQVRNIGTPILEKPLHSFEWMLRGGTLAQGFAGKVDGKWVVFFVAKTGDYAGKVVTIVVASEKQIQQWGFH
jgi:hypothetical protein